MSRKKPSRKQLLPLCSEIGPEDGTDPRLVPRPPAGRSINRKALQLCGQVARTLTSVFAESGDAVLRDLVVVGVTPAPNAGRLLVTVGPAGAESLPEAAAVLEALHRAAARLRTEVAAAVSRRRVPELAFRVRE